MVLKEGQGFGNFPALDANNELIRLARAGNAQFDEKSLGLCEEDGNIDVQYNVILYHLLAMDERLNPKKENGKDVVREDQTRSKALRKRKADKEISTNGYGCNVAEEVNEKHDQRMSSRAKTHKCGPSNQTRCAKNVQKLVSRSISIKETNNADGSRSVKLGVDHVSLHKGNTVVNEKISVQNRDNGRKLSITMKPKNRFSNQRPHLETRCRLDLEKSRNEARKAWIEKCSASEFREIKAAKCSMAHKNIEENNLEKEGKVRSDSDVEILDEAACVKRGITNPFVSSKKFSKSMEEDGIGESNEYDEFRKGVLNVLKKPYDREEYRRHLQVIQDGHYFEYHPDLERKLKKYRYNRRKRLAILRGFFFWLQNVTQEGGFKPWKDRACLAVEPSSP